MRMFDVTDEHVLDASPDEAFSALLSEYTGKSAWASPDLMGTPRSAAPKGEVGELFDMTVNRPGSATYTMRLAEVERPGRLRLEYVEGDFLGEGVWTFAPEGTGTRVTFRWHVRPRPLYLRVLSRFMDFEATHHDVMQAVFARLEAHLKEKPRGTAPRAEAP